MQSGLLTYKFRNFKRITLIFYENLQDVTDVSIENDLAESASSHTT